MRAGPGFRCVLLAVLAGALGCRGGSQVSCPAVLQACPATVPAEGSPCTPRGSAAFCEYGDDPWFDCDTYAYCDPRFGWHSVASTLYQCPTTLPSGCPASFAEARSAGQGVCASVPPGQLTCLYPEGLCQCTAAGLSCTAPAAAGCPATRPRAGTACGPACTSWGSGACDGQTMNCLCGVWQPIQCTD